MHPGGHLAAADAQALARALHRVRSMTPECQPLPARLRASPGFALALMPDGRPFVAESTEPYRQYWLDDAERRLLAAFATRRGLAPEAGLAQCGGGPEAPAAARRAWRRRLQGLLQAGVIEDPAQGSSRYAGRVVAAYRRHRPFPPEIVERLVRCTQLAPGQRVLDLAGGPGDLALQLARQGARVTLMDWSGGFLQAARREARALGLPLTTLHESANRLLHDDSRYELITVAQALHWLDDLAVCRGVARALAEHGHFAVVHSAIEVPDGHPLAHVLGPESVLGAKPRSDFGDEVQALQHRVRLLLQAVQAPGVDRIAIDRRPAGAPLGTAGLWRWRQTRSFGPGFLQALLSDRHLLDAGLEPAAFWADVKQRCAGLPERRLQGTQHWALLHFARGSDGACDARRVRVRRIGCAAPA